jgi:hypothetical protein
VIRRMIGTRRAERIITRKRLPPTSATEVPGTPEIPGIPYVTRAGLPMRVRESRVHGSATPGWRKVSPYRTGSLPSKSDEAERASASSASNFGCRRKLAGSLVAMPASWGMNRLNDVLRITSQVFLDEMITVNIGSLRF